MNLVELIEENMPSNLSKYELARYIYIITCKYFCYDKSFIHSFHLKYHLTHLNDFDINDIKSNEKICTTWSIIYAKLLRHFGISAWPYYQGSHAWVEFKINRTKYYADATRDYFNDLSRVHKNAKINNFYKIYSEDNPYILPIKDKNFEKEIEKSNIDSIINYYPDFEIKLNELKEKLNLDNPTNIILKEILDNIDLTSTGFIEDLQYINYIFLEFDPKEKKMDISSSYNKKENKFLNIISTEDEYYLVGSTISSLKETPKEKVKTLFRSNYEIPYTIHGIKKEHK